jgi:hypothetical protein
VVCFGIAFKRTEAAGTVGWTKDELEQVGDMLSADRSVSLALMQTKELLKK